MSYEHKKNPSGRQENPSPFFRLKKSPEIMAFFKLGKTYRTFVPPLGNHGKIMKIFLEVLVFGEREDDCNLIAVLINYILFNSTHRNS